MGALICVPLESNPAQRLRQRHIYSGAASRRVSGVTEANQGCWPARRGSCYPPRAEGTEGGNRVSRACETWGGEDAASWHLPLSALRGCVVRRRAGQGGEENTKRGSKVLVTMSSEGRGIHLLLLLFSRHLSGAGMKPGTMQRTEWVKVYPAGVAPGDGASAPPLTLRVSSWRVRQRYVVAALLDPTYLDLCLLVPVGVYLGMSG